MELNYGSSLNIIHQRFSQFAREVGFSSSRWAIEHDLFLVLEESYNITNELTIDEDLLSQLVERVHVWFSDRFSIVLRKPVEEDADGQRIPRKITIEI